MKSAGYIATYRRLRQEPFWRLLAADHSPMILGLLQSHLLQDERRMPASLFFERIEQDLEDLRASGVDMPQYAQAYLADWLAAGFLERHFPPGATEEEYELSTAAEGAIRFVTSLVERRTTATESRLSVVIQQLVRLAEETDSNPETRLSRLLAERKRIDLEIESIKDGHVNTLEDAKALERTREIINLAEGLIGDFRRVRDEFAELNGELRARIINDEQSRGEVLDSLFAGVDLISESPAGRSFSAFWRLLTDPEQSASFDDAIDQVLSRKFSERLTRSEQRFLRHVTNILLKQGGTVQEGLQHFARSLKYFVRSREFIEQRRLNRLLGLAQRAALSIRDAARSSDVDYTLVLTSCRLRSLSQMKLCDPSSSKIDGRISTGEAADIDIESLGELVAESEIDFRTIKEHIRDILRERSQASIAEIMCRYPAEQGLGTVVGYVALGSRFGLNVDHREEVSWRGKDDKMRTARIPIIFFSRDTIHELI